MSHSLKPTADIQATVHADYLHLHANPELSMQEHQTAAYIDVFDIVPVGPQRLRQCAFRCCLENALGKCRCGAVFFDDLRYRAAEKIDIDPAFGGALDRVSRCP